MREVVPDAKTVAHSAATWLAESIMKERVQGRALLMVGMLYRAGSCLATMQWWDHKAGLWQRIWKAINMVQSSQWHSAQLGNAARHEIGHAFVVAGVD